MSTVSSFNINGKEYEIPSIDSSVGDVAVYDDISSADLNIGDENGNIIVQFQDGHLKTKNFDSENISSSSTGFTHDLNGLSVLIVGDSITYGQSLSNPTTDRWGQQLADKYNWNVTINAVGGIPMATDSNGRDSIVTRLESSLTTMTTPDLILIWGGHNDGSYRASPYGTLEESDTTTYCGAFRYAMECCHKYAPNAKVFLFSLIHGGAYDPYDTMTLSPEVTTAQRNLIVRDCADMWGAEYINMGCCGINEVSGDSGVLTSDNVHPNALGTTQIVAYLSRQLELRYVKYIE